MNLPLDKFQEECGVFAVFNHPDASALTALGLHALQHRGQEACGIVSREGDAFHAHRGLGLVDKVFSQTTAIKTLQGNAAIGHNRYATTGGTSIRNIQPLYADLDAGGVAIAHNGNLTNALTVRQELVKDGAIFQSTTDTETIIHLVARSRQKTLAGRLSEAMMALKGAYSLVAIGRKEVIAMRDPLGIRPLVMGTLDKATVFASETCALDIIGARFVRDIKPGEMIVCTEEGQQSFHPFPPQKERFCIFEYIYFARPDSLVDELSVYAVRKNIGVQLAIEAPCPGADVIVPVPDSGVPSAMGFAQQSGIPFEMGIIRNHYVGRTFIQPTQGMRHLGVRLKHNPNSDVLRNKKVVLVDDSIVRGTTSQKIVEMVRAAGAAEVHMRISSPPTAHPCFYGIDTPDQKDLLAHRFNVADIARMLQVDSLAYISVDGLYRAVGEKDRNQQQPQFCDACFTGDYPVDIADRTNCGREAQVSSLQEID